MNDNPIHECLNVDSIQEFLNVLDYNVCSCSLFLCFRFSVNMLNVMEEIHSRVSEIKWPFFILHGSADKLCKLEGSQMLCDRASSKVKSLKVISY